MLRGSAPAGTTAEMTRCAGAPATSEWTTLLATDVVTGFPSAPMTTICESPAGSELCALPSVGCTSVTTPPEPGSFASTETESPGPAAGLIAATWARAAPPVASWSTSRSQLRGESQESGSPLVFAQYDM